MTTTDGIMSGGDAAALLARLPRDVSELLPRARAAAPGLPALCDETGQWSYEELGSIVAETAALLTDLGVTRGMRVAVIGENSRATAAWLLAGWACGACMVPLNPKLPAPELDAILACADAAVTVFCLAGSTQLRAYAASRGAQFHDRDGLRTTGICLAPDLNGVGRAAEPGTDVALLIFTSGTSGTPKGVMLTHTNLLFMAAASGAVRQLTPLDRLYLVLPLSHIVGLSVILLGGLMHLAAVQLAAAFNPRALLGALRNDGVSILLGTPALFRLLADYAGGACVTDAPGLRIISASGAPLDPATKAVAEALFGLPLHHGYGLTECAPTIAQVRPGEETGDCMVGCLLPGVQARLVGPSGAPADPGGTGELLVRGPNVMRGYFRDAAATGLVLDAQGWFRTGDLARFDGAHLHIVGRTKEMVIRFGYNVFPAEVEAVLASHPCVAVCAVLGRVAQGEEELVAFVQSRPTHDVTATDLSRHVADRLAPYKRPSRYVITDRLPLNEFGKVRKHELANA